MRRSILSKSILLVTMAWFCTPGSMASERLPRSPMQPLEVVEALVGLGSREAETGANQAAAGLLSSMLGDRGWQVAASRIGALETIDFTVAGQGEGQIVIGAHYDAVAGSAGAIDNASGCGVILSTATRLETSPRFRDLRVVLFNSAEQQLAGSRQWLEAMSEDERSSIFVALIVDRVGIHDRSSGVLRPDGSGRGGERAVAPVWLVHESLQGAEAAGFRLVLADRAWPIFAQLALRVAYSTQISDSQAFLAKGVPALTLSDVSITDHEGSRPADADDLVQVDPARLERWTAALNAIILQIDAVRGRPLDDTEYLHALGRLWIRRDLLWAGLILWAPLVFRGLPGRWQGADADTKRRRGRAYVPGFVFRMLFLLSLVVIPTLAAVMLFPSAILAWFAPSSHRTRRLMVGAAAITPLVSFSIWIILAQIGGHLVIHRGALLPSALVIVTLVSFWLWRVDQRPFQSA